MEIYFLKGIIAGFLLGIPVGPLGVIAIRKMIVHGSLHGIFFGLGFALVDIIYASIIGMGINLVSNFIVMNKFLISLLGAIFFIVFGIKIFFSKISLDSKSDLGERAYLGSFTLSFFVALTSPTTLLAFTAVFTCFNLGFYSIKSFLAFQIISGIVIGGCLSWIILSLIMYYIKKRIGHQYLKYVNKFFGILIIVNVVLIFLFNWIK